MAARSTSGIVRGYRGIRELLGVRMATVCALVRFDAGRPAPVLVHTMHGRRPSVRATAGDVWRLFREFESARGASIPSDE